MKYMAAKLRCPEARTRQAGDESLDFCNLNDKVCLLESTNMPCQYYEDYLKEMKDEQDSYL